MRVLFLGDIVGKPGREGIAETLPAWQKELDPDIVIANGENAAGGIGITPDIANEIFSYGVDVVTLGNHAFQKREIMSALEIDERLLRPANYPPSVPGRGWGSFPVRNTGERLTVVTLCGRVFMDQLDDPFRAIDRIIDEIDTPCIWLDFHAEATSEKVAMGHYVDGRVSAVVGTHTHVPTADERVLPGGTAYMTDAGMCGPINSVIGMDTEVILQRFLTQLPARFEVATGLSIVCGVLVEIDGRTGKASSIRRLQCKSAKS